MQAFNEKCCCNTSNTHLYFLWLKNLVLHSCVTVLVHKLHELLLTQFDLWQIKEKPRQYLLWSGPGEDWTRIHIYCWGLLLFQVQCMKSDSKVDVLTEKCCSQKHRWNSPRKSGSHCLWACAYVNKYVCLCACSCMHVSAHCFCVMDLVLIHSKGCVLLGFPNVEAFLYANWKLSVKN